MRAQCYARKLRKKRKGEELDAVKEILELGYVFGSEDFPGVGRARARNYFHGEDESRYVRTIFRRRGGRWRACAMSYFDGGLASNPTPSIAAVREWHCNGVLGRWGVRESCLFLRFG